MLAVYSVVAFLVYAFAFIKLRGWIVNHFGVNDDMPRFNPLWGILLKLLHVGLIIPAVWSLKDQPARATPMIVGVVITAVGLCVSLWAQWVLGKSWASGIQLSSGHQLVTTGPYRYVRHPMYSGLLLSTIGLGVFSWNIWFFALILSLTGSFMLRIPAENLALQKEFGIAYRWYAEETGALVPGFWKR